ncbi:MAG: hypothetical protein PHP05_09470, partial [Sideroxydans sp.]|nr:hypothetical protein [Sideroxydans sp.]
HILTTQNLAVLFQGLGLGSELQGLDDLGRQCFMWICRRQQMKIHQWHARLIMVKNTAYAWRQMVFFLSLLPQAGVIDFLNWAEEYLSTQTHDFRRRFHPVLTGLAVAASGAKMDGASETSANARRFLGWSNTKHWLLSDVDYR